MLADVIQSASRSHSYHIESLALDGLGVLYASLGQYKKAESEYKEALKNVPSEDQQTPWVATINSNLADAYRVNRQLPDAEKQYAHTVDLQQASGTEASQKISDMEKYSSVLAATKKVDHASAVKKQAETMKADTLEIQLPLEAR